MSKYTNHTLHCRAMSYSSNSTAYLKSKQLLLFALHGSIDDNDTKSTVILGYSNDVVFHFIDAMLLFRLSNDTFWESERIHM